MEVLAGKDFFRDVNIFNTTYYPTNVMLYFEKHHIFEIIFDLMVQLLEKLPPNPFMYFAENLVITAKKYQNTNVAFKCPPDFNIEQLAKVCSRVNEAPIIEVKNPSSRFCLEKLQEQLERFKLDKKNLIFLGPDDRVIKCFLKKRFHLNGVMNSENFINAENENAENDLEVLLPLALDIQKTVQLLSIRPNHKHVKYVERIVFIGRPGSGKHRQARLLAERLNLILISVNELINRARTEKNLFEKTLEIGLADNVHTSELITTIVEKRILQPDCLRIGWILVDFPNTAEDVENLFQLLVAPQVVVNVHTNERLCWKRKTNPSKIQRNWEGNVLDQKFYHSMVRAELNFYELNKLEVEAALERQSCVVFDIDGNNGLEKVHSDIITKLAKFPTCEK
ncbi:uncharacterized protein LOC129749774 [Uranotaenia lowii]|uniref:uncharacterized protein LOC129749774 n=1 Tax=Uranotaenia lowii TaxID=190385 RepID=UPI0024791629|nr:uncharacterized protein LOC129749774 [Uranotaenia lowii]